MMNCNAYTNINKKNHFYNCYYIIDMIVVIIILLLLFYDNYSRYSQVAITYIKKYCVKFQSN